jgi:V8-like Glu-specific endopeptidase
MSAGLPATAAPVSNTNVPPFSAIGMMAMRWTTGDWFYGTGALIDNRTILTCSHNLVDPVTDPPPLGNAAQILFYPAYNTPRPANPPPGGLAVRAGFYSGRFQRGEDAWDVAVCRLAATHHLPPPGVWFQPVSSGEELMGHEVDLAGYPGPQNGRMWWDRDEIAGVHVPTNTCIFTHDTWPGNSGSPVWTLDDDAMGVNQHAIHVSRQAQELRRGVLITQAVLAWIANARAQPNPPVGTLLVPLA